ncbi:hypothetical protein V1512DRAFT_265051 [Lipomyces arxii]|uniref:uncharacterized protein n=1 Tax=Lipomyces arxii TaxID=56418 RepID=UPI0034CFF1D8
MAKPKVLVVNDITTDRQPFLEFQKKFECIRYHPTTKEQFALDMQKPEYSDIQAVWNMFYGFIEFGQVDDQVYDALPPTVKVFSIGSVGYDRFNVAKLTDLGIILTNNPGLGAGAVADIALYLTLSTFRFLSVFEHSLRHVGQLFDARNGLNSDRFENGIPAKPEVAKFGFGDNVGGRVVTSPHGKRCGVIGMGAIGKEIVGRMKAIGMEIHYYTRTPLTQDALDTLPVMVAHDSVEDLLPVCDVVILAVPHSPATQHLLNSTSLSLLPHGARVVNIGRGALIDTEALLDALNTGQVSAAGLDVFEGEPGIHPGLLNRWDVTILPHVGSATLDTVIEAEDSVMKNIENVLMGGDGLTPVNKVS